MSHSAAVLLAFACLFLLFAPASLRAQQYSAAVIWSEAGLPAADSAVATSAQLAQVFPGSHLTATDQLAAQLADPKTKLLILPQASVIPEAAWSSITEFLHHGGNLLVLGGRPFTRAAFRDSSGWHLRDYSTRFTRPLLIDQYQATPGSDGATFTLNPEIPIDLPQFSWKQAFSPIIRLSVNDLYNRGGSAGSLDVNLDALVWGVSDGRKMSGPLLQIDHYSSAFDGGRWIFLSAELTREFYSSPGSSKLLRTLADRALEGALRFSVRPTLPLYLPGEPIELETIFHSTAKPAVPLTVAVTSYPEDKLGDKQTAKTALPATTTTLLPAPDSKGLHIVEARLFEGKTLRAIYHSAFWIRDEAYLRSGPKLGVTSDYFTIDGKPLAVIGTTYMSSEAQRLFFDHPNVYVWNADLGQIHSAGLNMIRTGWWTGWDKLCDETGRPYERTLRTLEAYLMTARKHNLPVQFNFFAFLPEILGGVNPYLDGQAVRKQQNLVASVTARFHDVPFLAWDLINEPSFSKKLWQMRPNDDPVELAAWNAWLAEKYPDRAALAATWNVTPESVAGTISIPSEQEFSQRGVYVGINSLRVYDFVQFAQEKFADWVHGMHEVIRATGSNAPITVGQDEGGYLDRLNPAFFADSVDFTTNHSWWQDDDLLWDSLVAKQPGKAMLIQETGLQRELTPDEIARLTPGQEAALFERKVALSFAQGSGAIEWLWNSNSYMTESNETPIGALHADGTEKPEASVLRGMAAFAAAASPFLVNPKRPGIAIVTSQAAQFSLYGQLQIEAQQNTVRSLAYGLHQPCYIIAENQIDKLGSPKLAILPSPQALRESTWQTLLTYVRNGGNLLVTGPVSRDEHWHLVDRYTPLGIRATTEPLTFKTGFLGFGQAFMKGLNPGITVSFDQQKQQMLETLQFPYPEVVKLLPLEKGQLIWAAYPVELSEGPGATSTFYRQVLDHVGIKLLDDAAFISAFTNDAILGYRVELDSAFLYIFESEIDRDISIDTVDPESGGHINLKLAAQRAALAVIDKKSKQIVAKYGF